MLKRVLVGVVGAGFGLSMLLAPVASATPMPSCGYFSGFEDCGDGGNSPEPVIRLQPAPEEPWVWPEEGALAPYIWSPYTKREGRHSTTKPPIRTKKTKTISCTQKGSFNPACW